VGSKSKKSEDRQRQLKLMTTRRAEFAERQRARSLQEIDLPFLTKLCRDLTGKSGTQKRDQENLRGFFGFCVKAKWISDNPAADLETIHDNRPRTDVFTHDELKAIIDALSEFRDEYGQCGGSIAHFGAFRFVLASTGAGGFACSVSTCMG
jgi:site-specific recombinase XerD